MKLLASGHEVEEVSDDWLERVGKNHGHYYSPGMLRVKPEGWLYPAAAPIYLDKLQNFQFKSTDVVVTTFLKSGTTWMQEILWTMLHNPDLQNPMANIDLIARSPELHIDMFLHGVPTEYIPLDTVKTAFTHLCPGRNPEDGMFTQICEMIPGRRVLKSHYPLALMPNSLLDTAKVVYVARNPKDVMVSFFHFMKKVQMYDFRGDFEEFVQHFMDGDLVFSPYWPHMKDAWEKRHHPNLLFVFYEDMKEDIMKEVQRINDFLGTNLKPQQLQNVVTHTTFSAMKKRGDPIKEDGVYNPEEANESAYFRKGEVGDWVNYFSPELLSKVDHWIAKEATKSGITFPTHTSTEDQPSKKSLPKESPSKESLSPKPTVNGTHSSL